jgi:hypothetical protein
MIKEIIVYTYICDRCSKNSSDEEENCGWNDAGYAWDCASDNDWIEHEGKHYCSGCYDYDNDDNLIIKD